jgi:hypothetical protein
VNNLTTIFSRGSQTDASFRFFFTFRLSQSVCCGSRSSFQMGGAVCKLVPPPCVISFLDIWPHLPPTSILLRPQSICSWQETFYATLRFCSRDESRIARRPSPLNVVVYTSKVRRKVSYSSHSPNAKKVGE